MIKANKNQLANIENNYQTKAKRVLCVCSAGLLRSPTMANVIFREFGFNTRSCGTAKGIALIPITEALITWADEIVFSNREAMDYLTEEELDIVKEKQTILNIPDHYDWNEKGLVDKILNQYDDIKENKCY